MTPPATIVRPGANALRALRPDHALADHPILDHMRGLDTLMTFRDMPFQDYFDVLQNETRQIGHVHRADAVDNGNGTSYLAALSRTEEQVLDQINAAHIKCLLFTARVKGLLAKVRALKAAFMVMWTVVAADIIQDTPISKLSATNLKALGRWEFTSLIGQKDLELKALDESLERMVETLKSRRKLAETKYAMGMDQVNAAQSTIRGENRGFVDQSTWSAAPVETDDDQHEPLWTPVAAPVDGLDEIPPEAVIPNAVEAVWDALNPESVKAQAAPKGQALVVDTPLDIVAPGITRGCEKALFSKRTKLLLTAQEAPAEIGSYRFNGPNQPLSRLDELAKQEDPRVTAPVPPVNVQAIKDKMVSSITVMVDTPPIDLPRPIPRPIRGTITTVVDPSMHSTS